MAVATVPDENTCKKCDKPLTTAEAQQGGICTGCLFGRL